MGKSRKVLELLDSSGLDLSLHLGFFESSVDCPAALNMLLHLY